MLIKKLIFLVIITAFSSTVSAQNYFAYDKKHTGGQDPRGGSMSLSLEAVSLNTANQLLNAALNKAKDMGIEVGVAVTDSTGSLRAFKRADGAAFLVTDVAINKAWTSASYGVPTHIWNQLVKDPSLTPITNLPKLMAVGGGYPLRLNGKIIGGIGVSGGTAAQDQLIAESALTSVGFELF